MNGQDLFAPNIAHRFFTRQGGVSTGLYESLNVGPGSGDDPAYVQENRALCVKALGAQALVTNYQVHGARVIIAQGPADDRAHQADGLVTDRPGLALGILTADCVPVLFSDPSARVIGAAHAGWRGAAAGVLEATLTAMEGLGADRSAIVAAIGPAIQQPSYEVGPEVRQVFCEGREGFERFFVLQRGPDTAETIQNSLKYLFDLPGAVAHFLRFAEIAEVHHHANDTYTDEAHYFSYRRATHRAEPDYGRHLSAICLKSEEDAL